MRLALCLHCRRPIEAYPDERRDQWFHVSTLVPMCSPDLYEAVNPNPCKETRRQKYVKKKGWFAEPIDGNPPSSIGANTRTPAMVGGGSDAANAAPAVPTPDRTGASDAAG